MSRLERRTPTSGANQNTPTKPQTPPTSAPAGLRAYSDPVIYRDDRVLRTLLRKEHRYVPDVSPAISAVQTEVKAHMRKEVADWMLEVCEDQQAQPEVFCLAMNYLDRFLGLCAIGRSQLQLLGAVCLLVAWKVREHQQLPAMRLVEYSDYNLTLIDIMVSHFLYCHMKSVNNRKKRPSKKIKYALPQRLTGSG